MNGLLELKNIFKRFPVRKGFFGGAKEYLCALNGVSLSIAKGESLGLVGESGCGKSTLGRISAGLMKPTSGSINFAGKGGRPALIFQDPFASLNPRMSIGDIVAEPLLVNKIGTKKERTSKVKDVLISVGLDAECVQKYPHEFSGGQRQRISIARALILEPELIIADEPVSSLDVAVQAEILALLRNVRRDLGLSLLFISHDLRIVSSVCDRIVVMYLGTIVEDIPASKIKEPSHPYTIALLSAVPIADPAAKGKRIILKGDVPSPINMPSGCPFHPRCHYAEEVCKGMVPVLEDKGNGCLAACHLTEKVRRGM